MWPLDSLTNEFDLLITLAKGDLTKIGRQLAKDLPHTIDMFVGLKLIAPWKE